MGEGQTGLVQFAHAAAGQGINGVKIACRDMQGGFCQRLYRADRGPGHPKCRDNGKQHDAATDDQNCPQSIPHRIVACFINIQPDRNGLVRCGNLKGPIGKEIILPGEGASAHFDGFVLGKIFKNHIL